MTSLRLTAFALSVIVIACHRPEAMRAEEDAADPLRRCVLPAAGALPPEEQAIHCGEWFIARQGYTDSGAVIDSALLVPEGIEWEARDKWLSSRKGSLEARAFGVCRDAQDGSFTVAFRASGTASARGVTMDRTFGSLRMQHQDFLASAVDSARLGCRRLSRQRPNGQL